MIVETIDGYHRLSQTIWPVAQLPPKDTNTKLHPPITKSDTRQLKRITRLRNTAKSMLPKQTTDQPTKNNSAHTIQIRTQASEVLKLPDPPKLEDIPVLCHKAIPIIINKAIHKLADSLRKKEDQLYKKTPKRYHNNLKTAAGLQPNAKDQPKLDAIKDPATNSITTHPPQIIDILHTHFEKEHSRNTPDHIPPPPPWQNPLNPDPYTNPKPISPAQQHTLDHFLTKNTTPPHATEHRRAKHLDQTQSQMNSSNTYQIRHTATSTSCFG